VGATAEDFVPECAGYFEREERFGGEKNHDETVEAQSSKKFEYRSSERGDPIHTFVLPYI